MINKDIKRFFANVRNDVSHAKTSKTLRYLESHAKSYMEQFDNSAIKPGLKKLALKEYKTTVSHINTKKKQLD